MSKTILKLRDDHRKMARLMDLISREVRAFDAGEAPDYDLVENILEYVINYPDLNHHPLEDLVLTKLCQRDRSAASNVGDLEAEHEKLGALTRRFAAALKNIMADAALPRDWFVEVASDYLVFQRRHMQMEEVVFFPAALRALTDEDWKDIEDVTAAVRDPVFDHDIQEEKFNRLHQEILRWAEAS